MIFIFGIIIIIISMQKIETIDFHIVMTHNYSFINIFIHVYVYEFVRLRRLFGILIIIVLHIRRCTNLKLILNFITISWNEHQTWKDDFDTYFMSASSVISIIVCCELEIFLFDLGK